MATNTFSKSQRLCSDKLIERLFKEGNRSAGCFPVRLVWLELPPEVAGNVGIQLLISAPKRNFKHAVDRNRIKRQIREYYRTATDELKATVGQSGKSILLAVLFTDSCLWNTADLVPKLEHAFGKLLQSISSSNVK